MLPRRCVDSNCLRQELLQLRDMCCGDCEEVHGLAAVRNSERIIENSKRARVMSVLFNKACPFLFHSRGRASLHLQAAEAALPLREASTGCHECIAWRDLSPSEHCCFRIPIVHSVHTKIQSIQNHSQMPIHTRRRRQGAADASVI